MPNLGYVIFTISGSKRKRNTEYFSWNLFLYIGVISNSDYLTSNIPSILSIDFAVSVVDLIAIQVNQRRSRSSEGCDTVAESARLYFQNRVSMNVFSFKYRNVILGVTATAFGYFAVLMPHTVFLKKYRYMMARYQLNKEMPLGRTVEQRIQIVMDDLKLSDNVRDAIKPFSVFGFDMFHAGSFNTKYGSILGIPYNFTNTSCDIRENLLIKEEPVDWTRQDAQSFIKSVILSENAQKFAIAREILRIQTEEPYFNSLTLALTIATIWTFYNLISYKFRLREAKAMVRRTFYVIFILFSPILWFGIKDYRSYQLDRENDEALCRLGTEYIKGGQEFYEKMLSRNRAIRTLAGAEGKGIYTAYGNEKTFLRQKHVPISHRKDFFDSQLRNLESMK